MAQEARNLPDAPIVATIEEPEPSLNFDDWLRQLATDEPVTVDVGSAEVIRELREHGER